MKNTFAKLMVLVLIVLMVITAVGCSNGSKSTSSEENHLIGVAVFSSSDPELSMFFDYYREYIAESFPVSFMISESLSSSEDEIAFIEEMKSQGAEAIISFFGSDLESIVEACEENEIYYVLGSIAISDEEYEAVKDNPWFLGTIGADSEEEFRAGEHMATNFINQGAESFLILSGGAMAQSNYMHYVRVTGMLTALAEELGLSYSESIEELAQVTELTVVETDREDITIVISPGYLDIEMGSGNMTEAFDYGNYDALMSAAGVSSVIDLIADKIEASGSRMLVGVVDSFTEENYEAVERTDAAGNSLLNYVEGKYASMVAPAFVAVFNAIKGDIDVVKPEGVAFRLYQSYWTATSEAEYVELYGYTQSIYENAYSSWDLMQVIKAYNEDADYESFRLLTESCDIDSVKERMGK